MYPGDLDELKEALSFVAQPMRRDSAQAALVRVRRHIDKLDAQLMFTEAERDEALYTND